MRRNGDSVARDAGAAHRPKGPSSGRSSASPGVLALPPNFGEPPGRGVRSAPVQTAYLDGGPGGNDVIFGGEGSDYADGARDIVNCGDGTDTVYMLDEESDTAVLRGCEEVVTREEPLTP